MNFAEIGNYEFVPQWYTRIETLQCRERIEPIWISSNIRRDGGSARREEISIEIVVRVLSSMDLTQWWISSGLTFPPHSSLRCRVLELGNAV